MLHEHKAMRLEIAVIVLTNDVALFVGVTQHSAPTMSSCVFIPKKKSKTEPGTSMVVKSAIV